MPIHEATYTMSNVGFSNSVSLPGNQSQVLAGLDASIPGSKWNIIPLRGLNRYHIQNDHQQPQYAWCKIAKKGESVIGSSLNRTEWVIKETGKSGHYIISPADDESLFWGLEDDKADTPLELRNGPATLRQNQWQFHHHGGPRIIENIIDDFQLTLDWMDTTTTQVPFKAHVSGNLQRSDLPADANISFPKPLRVVWKKLIIGYANLKATYGAFQADEHAYNALVTPTSDDDILFDFVRALLKEKSISVELQAEEVSVHAAHKDYPIVRGSFRKPVTIEGFNYLKDQFIVEKIRITGSDQNGNSLTARTDISIRNPSNISVLVDELPIEVYYKNVKIADFTIIGPFKLHHSSAGIEFRVPEIPVKFQPENSRDKRCKEFIAKYITTGESIEISLCMERAVIKLASSTISIPRFKVTSKVDGIDKQFITGCTAYIMPIRAALVNHFYFTFDFENPIDTSLTITFIQGEAKRKNVPIWEFHGEMEMTVQANAPLTSEIIRKSRFHLTLGQMIAFIGKREVKVDIDVQRANVSVGQFHLPDLTFNKLTNIKAILKWSL